MIQNYNKSANNLSTRSFFTFKWMDGLKYIFENK